MAIDLFANDNDGSIRLSLTYLAAEAGIGVDPDPIVEEEGVPDRRDPPRLSAAVYDCNNGLVVTDGYTGQQHRLLVVAVPFPPTFFTPQDNCPNCRSGSYSAAPQGEQERVECASCGFTWLEPL